MSYQGFQPYDRLQDQVRASQEGAKALHSRLQERTHGRATGIHILYAESRRDTLRMVSRDNEGFLSIRHRDNQRQKTRHKNSRKTPFILRSTSEAYPSLLHRYSIVTPSLLHRNDGLSMDYRWIILRGRADSKRYQKVGILTKTYHKLT